MEKINITIDGKKIACEPGISIMDAASENGIRIPSLCNHNHLEPIGACRLCLVEEENSKRLFASCVKHVSEGMTIRTETPEIRKYRKNIIRLMIANHPESCIVCNRGNRCELRQVAADLGVGDTHLYPMPFYTELEEANPFIVRDLSKCILCGRCIRADHELVMVGAIDYNLRGFKSRPAALLGRPLEKSSCTFCGTCVSLCPTGALMTKTTGYAGSPQKEQSTVCGFCGVGCTLLMGSVEDKIVEVNPSHEPDTVNLSTLCVKGHFAHDFLNSPSRLTSPMIRKEDELTPVTWEEALDYVAERLISIKKENGPQSIAFLGSSKCSNEENYLFQKMSRVLFETNNVDNGGYVYGRTPFHILSERLKTGERVKPLKDLEKAELIFLIGADPLHSAPVAGYYIKRASRVNGIPLVVADPRKTELLSFASIWLPLNPQTDNELLNGLAAVLYRNKKVNMDFIERYTIDFDHYSRELADLNLENITRITGVEGKIIEQTAELMSNKRTAFVFGNGMLQQRNGVFALNSLINLALMTGNLGGEGNGFFLITKESNQAGALDMGSVPDLLPGRQSLRDERAKKYWEQKWETVLSPDPGLDMVRMIKEAKKGNLKALYIMGENPARSLPQREEIKESLSNLEFLIVQDILSNETSELADVVLPGAAFSEKSGSFTNMEGRIQFFDPVVPPPGEARPDWEILDMVMERTSNKKRYETIGKIRAEIGHMAPMYDDIGKDTKNRWIKDTGNIKLFSTGKQGDLLPFTKITRIREQQPEKDFPFNAVLGSSRYHLGSGTRTGYSKRINSFMLKGEARLSPADIKRLRINEGDSVRISSPHGKIDRTVRADKGLKQGMIFIPTGFFNNDAMELLDLAGLDGGDSPGWKSCAVRIEAIRE